MNHITTILAVKGAPLYLKDALASVEKLSYRILIADIGMDEEVALFLSKNPRIEIIRIKEPVPYVELIRDTLKKRAKTDYVLFLDPDEVIPPSLASLWTSKLGTFDYCVTPRKNIIFGKWIEHSRWWPDYQIRIFRKTSVTWPKIIHKQPVTKGSELKLEANEAHAILHHNYESLDEYVGKMMRYAKAEAFHEAELGSTRSLGDTVHNALSEFFSRYFAAEGYRDGMRGFVLAILQMFYCFLVYFYLWEKNGYASIPEPEVSRAAQNFFRSGLYETNYWLEKSTGKKQSLKTKLVNTLIKP